MIPRYQVLARRIEQEQSELSRTVATIGNHWEKAESGAVDPEAYLNSVALSLHSFYSGLERIFELIALEIDGGTLGGDAWHAELLRQMLLDMPDMRPAVLQPETASALDEYRRFRHRIRNIYVTRLDPERIKPLVIGLPVVWQQLQEQLSAFSAFLSNVGHTHPD